MKIAKYAMRGHVIRCAQPQKYGPVSKTLFSGNKWRLHRLTISQQNQISGRQRGCAAHAKYGLDHETIFLWAVPNPEYRSFRQQAGFGPRTVTLSRRTPILSGELPPNQRGSAQPFRSDQA